MTEQWMDKDELAAELRCSPRQIETYKSIGLFIGGEHYFSHATKAGSKGKHVYCLDLCRKALLANTAALAQEPIEKAKKVVITDKEHLSKL